MKTVGILNGPGLDRLGQREKVQYGRNTLKDLEEVLLKQAQELEFKLEFVQSNHEGALVETIWKWADSKIDGIVFNPAAYTHTSIALLDALKGVKYPAIEVHISQIYSRETFRRVSITGYGCLAGFSGLGFETYLIALRRLKKYWEHPK